MTTQPPTQKCRITKLVIEQTQDILHLIDGKWQVTAFRADGSQDAPVYRDIVPTETDPRMVGYYFTSYKAGQMTWKAK